MKVEDVMTQPVQTCRPDDPMSTAARIMWDHDCGCVPVVSPEGFLIGMITDRDLSMAAYTQGRALDAIPIHVGMATKVQSIGREATVDAALRMMSERQVRRLPVVDHWHRVVGILSINDLVRHASPRDRAAIAQTLAAICRHRDEAPAPAAQPRASRPAPARLGTPTRAQERVS
jgi:CBS domain-containing protein